MIILVLAALLNVENNYDRRNLCVLATLLDTIERARRSINAQAEARMDNHKQNKRETALKGLRSVYVYSRVHSSHLLSLKVPTSLASSSGAKVSTSKCALPNCAGGGGGTRAGVTVMVMMIIRLIIAITS